MSQTIFSTSNQIMIANNQFVISNGQHMLPSGVSAMITPQVNDCVRFYFMQCVGSEWDGTTHTLPIEGSFRVITEMGVQVGTITVNIASGETISYSNNEGETINSFDCWVTNVTEPTPNEFVCTVTAVQPACTGIDIRGYSNGDTINVNAGTGPATYAFDFTPAYTQPYNVVATSSDPSVVSAGVTSGPDPSQWWLNIEGYAAGSETLTLELYDANQMVIDTKTYTLYATIQYATYINLVDARTGTWYYPNDNIRVKSNINPYAIQVFSDGVPYAINTYTGDSSVATAYYDSANRFIYITPVVDGNTTLTVEFTEADGVTVNTYVYDLEIYSPSFATDFEIVGYQPGDTINIYDQQSKDFSISYTGGDEPYDMNFLSDDSNIVMPSFDIANNPGSVNLTNYGTLGSTTLTVTMTLSDGVTTVTHTYDVDGLARIDATDFDLSGYNDGDTIYAQSWSTMDIPVIPYPADSYITTINAYTSDGSIASANFSTTGYSPVLAIMAQNIGTTTLTVEMTDGMTTATKYYTIEVQGSGPIGDKALGGNAIAFLKGKLNERISTMYGAPDGSTYGTVGQLMEDISNGKLYICTDATNPYVWEEVGTGGGGNVFTDNEWNALWA